MKTFFKIPGSALLVIIVVLLFQFRENLKDRNPVYKADLKIINGNHSALNAGFAALPITPEVPDKWTDKNGDAKYNPCLSACLVAITVSCVRYNQIRISTDCNLAKG